MAILTSRYLGMDLANPLVPSSSPLTADLDAARRLEDAGAAALVLPSLFEEDILAEQARMDRFLEEQAIGHAEAGSFRPMPASYRSREDAYLETLASLKRSLAIPVIASLTGVTAGGWLEHARALEAAGADGLELNVYYLAGDPDESAESVEQRYVDIVTSLRDQVSLPIAMKLTAQLTAPIALVARLSAAGVAGVSLFNRFYQPDIDLDALEVRPRLHLSTPDEALLRVRWAAMLSGRVDCDIALTGGFHGAADVIKGLLAGANVICLCSILLQEGPAVVRRILGELDSWLEEHEYTAVDQLRGSLSHRHAPDPARLARANYLDVLDNYTPPSGVRH